MGRYFIMVKGLEGVKSNKWVEYSFSDRGFDIRGSYTLSYIK